MNATSRHGKLSLSVLLLTGSFVACAVEPATDDASESESAVTAIDCSAHLTPGTDIPGAEADSLCIVTADLGAKLREEASASSTDLLAEDGWGGLPCGYQLHVDLRDARAATMGAKANGCSVWSYGTATVNGDKRSGFINASLVECRRANETNDAFAKRFTPACTNFSNGTGTSMEQPASCEPGPGWTKKASHNGIRLADGSGSDSALVSTSSASRIAAVFKAYRLNTAGQTEYVGCFGTRVSGTYRANISAAYTINTTEGFYEYEGAVKRWATWADVDYYVVDGNASIK